MVLLIVSDRNLRFRTYYRCPLGTNIRQVPLTVQEQMLEQMQVFNVGEDCPVFSHMFQFCQVSDSVQKDLQMQSLEGKCNIASHRTMLSESAGLSELMSNG